MNTPRALAVAQELLKSKIRDDEKLATVLDFDKVLGLNLADALKAESLPEEIKQLAQARQAARERKDFKKADELRNKIEESGYFIEDTKRGERIYKK